MSPPPEDACGTGTAARDRDVRGRFVGTVGRRGRPPLSRIGRCPSGSSADAAPLQLARRLAGMEAAELRLLAELGRPAEAQRTSALQRMQGIREKQEASVERRRRAMGRVLRSLAEQRLDPSAGRVADMMRIELGLDRFAASQLYRPPLDTMWRVPSDHFGRLEGDDDVVRRHARLPRRQLERLIVLLRRRIAALEKEMAERLVAVGPDGEWRPIGG